MHTKMAGLPVCCISVVIQSLKSHEVKKPDTFLKKECVLFGMLLHFCKQHCIRVLLFLFFIYLSMLHYCGVILHALDVHVTEHLFYYGECRDQPLIASTAACPLHWQLVYK